MIQFSFSHPMEYQPERFLKDGKFNPDVLDLDPLLFGFELPLVFVFTATTRYTQLYPVSLQSMTSNRQLMTKALTATPFPLSVVPSGPAHLRQKRWSGSLLTKTIEWGLTQVTNILCLTVKTFWNPSWQTEQDRFSRCLLVLPISRPCLL